MKKQSLLNASKTLLCAVGLSGLLSLTMQSSSSSSISVGREPSKSLVEAIRREKGSSLARLFSEIKYWFIEEDLNSDGIKEAIVYTHGSDCGAWLCPVYIFQKNGVSYRLVDEVKVFIGGGVSILPSRSNGWNDIAFRVAKVGTIPLKVEWRKGAFNGKKYQLGKVLTSQPAGYILQYQQGTGISLANSGVLDPQENSVSRSPSDFKSQPIYKEQAYKGKALGAKVIQDLPSGNYTFCKRNTRTPCLTRFEFRKINNRVVGNYISADDEICIDGVIDGNTILGRGLDGPGSGPYKQPQKSNSSLQGNDLRAWIRDDNSLTVSQQSTFNLPLENYGGTGNTRYSAWFKYANIQLNLQGFQQKSGKSFNPPQRCQIIHPLTGKVIETSEPKISASRSPSTAQQYKEQGDSKSRNGDKQGAISDYTSAIRLNSSFAVAYYNRAIDRVSVGDQQGALADFRKAAELFKQQGKGSDQRDALNEIAKLQGEQPKQQEAKRSLLVTANTSSIRGATVEPGEKQKLKDLQWNAATQIVMDRLNCRDLPNKSRVCSLDLYNLGYANAVVEVYDAQRKLVEIRGVEGVRNPSSVFGFPVESVERLFKLKNGFGFNDPRISIGQQKLTEIRNLVIPSGGSFKITKSGVNADNYNNATFLMGFFFDSELNLPGSLPGSLQKIFGEDAAFRQTLLAALFVKVQEERTKNIVKDGGFNDPPRAFLTGQWIDQESFSNLVEVGLKVLAEESLKKRTKRAVIDQVVLGKKLNVWVTAAEVFAKSGNGFLQYFNRDQSQKAERQQGGIVFPKNN